MNPNRLLLSLVALFFSGILLRAQLINFDFTFTDNNPQPYSYEVDGTVTGEIIGLQNNATSLPEEVIITSAPAGLKIQTPLTLVSGGSTSGAITVSNDEVTGSTYVFNGAYLFAIGFTYEEPTQLGNYYTTDAYTLSRTGEEYIYAGLTNAPEPSTCATLLLGGLGLLAFFPRLRRTT